MDWKCNICSKKFKSDIIIYNKSEVNYIKKVINYGLLLKKLAHPVKLPCCQNIDVKTASFYHKKDCNGIIYFAEFHKKIIIICEKCKAVNNFGKFIWTCPGCSLRFKDMKWQENEPRLRKEIFSKKDFINNDVNNDDYSEDRRNIRNLESSDIEEAIQKKTRSKNKSNLYDILKKRTNFMADNNIASTINNIIPHLKNNKENKEVSTEGSDSKNNFNINNINLESYSDNQISDLIKVKRNLIPLNEDKKIFKNKEDKENQKNDKDDLSSDRKNLKKRYIFEKLIRRQFVSANNIMVNNNMENLYTNNDTETRILNEREKEIFLREFNELDISRCIGNLAAEELGVIPGPEIVESDIRLNKGKVLVMGTESLWKYLTEDEVGEIVNKHYSSSNSEAACKEIQDLAKERWKDKPGGYDDISVIVVFFDSKNL